MPHSKKQKLLEEDAAAPTDDDNSTSSFERLGTNELANVFGFLRPEDIMRARLNKKMREAAKSTIVPMTEFEVNSVDKYNAIAAMTTALPNLQQISISQFTCGFSRYGNGEDSDEDRAAIYANFTTHDITIISNFRKLRCLDLGGTPLNGRYPFLFNFPLLQKLDIANNFDLKWDLEMLAGLPLLNELCCVNNVSLTGSINSLRVLKDTLTKVTMNSCRHVKGNFMNLADFSHLKELVICRTGVTGDIRDIGERDFPTLESIILPSGVYGGRGYQFQRISDAPGIISTLYPIYKQRPTLLKNWYAKLSSNSPDWYHGEIIDTTNQLPNPPICIFFVEAGSRVGYQWESDNGYPCEVNWLDPEPDRNSCDHEKYIAELRAIQWRVNCFDGHYEPPSEDEYNLIVKELDEMPGFYASD